MHIRAERLRPAEPFALGALVQEGDLVVEEAEAAVGAEVFTGQDVTADDAGVRGNAGDFLDGRARETDHIGGIGHDRAGDGHLAGEVQLAGIDDMAEGGHHQRGHRPHGLTLEDGADVADLDAHVAGGMPAAHHMGDGVLHLVERRAGIDGLVHADVHPAVGQFAEGVHPGLEVGEPVAEGELGVGRERGGAERGDEDGLGLQVRIGLDAVGTLDEPPLTPP